MTAPLGGSPARRRHASRHTLPCSARSFHASLPARLGTSGSGRGAPPMPRMARTGVHQTRRNARTQLKVWPTAAAAPNATATPAVQGEREGAQKWTAPRRLVDARRATVIAPPVQPAGGVRYPSARHCASPPRSIGQTHRALATAASRVRSGSWAGSARRAGGAVVRSRPEAVHLVAYHPAVGILRCNDDRPCGAHTARNRARSLDPACGSGRADRWARNTVPAAASPAEVDARRRPHARMQRDCSACRMPTDHRRTRRHQPRRHHEQRFRAAWAPCGAVRQQLPCDDHARVYRKQEGFIAPIQITRDLGCRAADLNTPLSHPDPKRPATSPPCSRASCLPKATPSAGAAHSPLS